MDNSLKISIFAVQTVVSSFKFPFELKIVEGDEISSVVEQPGTRGFDPAQCTGCCSLFWYRIDSPLKCVHLLFFVLK